MSKTDPLLYWWCLENKLFLCRNHPPKWLLHVFGRGPQPLGKCHNASSSMMMMNLLHPNIDGWTCIIILKIIIDTTLKCS